MTALTPPTRRRLQQLKQLPSVWEGARLTMPSPATAHDTQDEALSGDCVLWVDGSEGIVRAVDMVPTTSGQEAVVRTLLRAMEDPHNPGQPARPQKIVVSDRELQFFLRGVLQEMNIIVDYVPNLPMIDEFYHHFMEASSTQAPALPVHLADEMNRQASVLWDYAPWNHLSEEQVISITLNQWDIDTLYVSIMGMLGMEYGILMYRSVDSLKQFRQKAMDVNGPIDEVQEAFLQQDCLFLTFDREDSDDLPPFALPAAPHPDSALQPSFGNLHPLEGMRFTLQEDEANAMLVALTALNRFFKQHRAKFSDIDFPEITTRYKITLPSDSTAAIGPKKASKSNNKKAKQSSVAISVTVKTMPELAGELLDMVDDGDYDDDDDDDGLFILPNIQDTFIPMGAMVTIGMIPWAQAEILSLSAQTYQPGSNIIKQKGDGLPILLVQTTLPKGKAMIKTLEEADGLHGICFNTGTNAYDNQVFDVGLLILNDGELQLFGEFLKTSPTHINARKKWDRRCQDTGGYCGLIIAKGVTGAARGNPQLQDMIALYEVAAISENELGMGPLEMKITGH